MATFCSFLNDNTTTTTNNNNSKPNNTLQEKKAYWQLLHVLDTFNFAVCISQFCL